MTNESRLMSGKTELCTHCLGYDPMHAEWDGWRGDCPYYLRGTPGADPKGTCSYGDCSSPSIAEPLCVTWGPQGPAPEPRGEPCDYCGGSGVIVQTGSQWWPGADGRPET